MSLEDRGRIEDALRRIEELVTGLSHIADPAAQSAARELVQAILDMHGIALARIMARIADVEEGRAVLDRLARDEQVKAVLLLYGLHPDDPETRLRQALAAMESRLAASGASVKLGRITANAVSLRVFGVSARTAALQREIEDAIADAAPDLDEVVIEWLEEDVAERFAAAG